MTVWGHLGEMGKVRGILLCQWDPAAPGQRFHVYGRHSETTCPKEALLHSLFHHREQNEKQKQPHHYNPSRPSLTVQALRGSFKCFSVEKGRVEEDKWIYPYSSWTDRTGPMQRQIISRKGHYDTCATIKKENNTEEKQ